MMLPKRKKVLITPGIFITGVSQFAFFIIIFISTSFAVASQETVSEDSIIQAIETTPDFSKLIPLGSNARTELYWDGDYRIYGDDGTDIYLHDIDIILDSLSNGYLELWDKGGVISSHIDIDSIYGNGILSFQSSLPVKETSFYIDSLDAFCYISINEIPQSVPFRRNILSHISTILYGLYSELFFYDYDVPFLNKLFVPDENTDIKDIENYYAYAFNDFCIETQTDGPYTLFYQFEKALESKDYITYFEYHGNRVGSGSMWNYGTHSYVTFDKHTGEIVTLEDIFNIDYICMLRYWLRQDLMNQDIFNDFILEDVPVGNMALAQNGLVFSYSPYELYSNRDFNVFVHYDNIWGMTKQKPPHFDERECQFHQAVITRNDTYYDHTKIYNSCEEAKHDLRKIDNSLPISSIWDIGYGYENVPDDRLISFRDSLLRAGGGKKVAKLNQEIQNRLDSTGLNHDYYYISLDSLALEKADYFVKKKCWDMAIDHVLIALNNLPTREEDTHNYYPIPNFLFDYIWYSGNKGKNGGNQYVDCVIELGDICSMAGEGYEDDAIGYYKRATSSLNYLLKKYFQEEPPQQRSSFWNRYTQWYLNTLPILAYDSQDDTLRIAAYDAALLGKGLELNTSRAERQAIYESNDSILINLLDTEDQLKSRLPCLNDSIQVAQSQMTSSINENSIIKNQLAYIEELKTKQDSISNMLSQTTAEKYRLLGKLGRFSQNIDIKCSDLSKVLQEGELAVEFVHSDENPYPSYYAITLKKGQQVPTIIRLFNESKLPDVELKSQDLKKLYRLIWKPLENQLQGVKKVFFSPSGQLYDYSIEYAINSDGNTFDQQYDVHRLSSTAVLYNWRHLQTQTLETDDKAALLGGLTYDGDKGFLERDQKRYAEINRGLNESLASPYTIHKDRHFSYLPGTKAEVIAIKDIIEKTNMFHSVSIYQDTTGTENLLKSFSGNKFKLLHIATHGGIDVTSSHPISSNLDSAEDIYDDFLRKVYLALSGANSNVSNQPSSDGLADGLEISSMNLSGLELVVLSTCESGRGWLIGDGLLGLQSAFKKAGTQSIMMSLRPVHDDATRLLMTAFYENLSSGMPLNTAFSKAQSMIREYNNGVYADPYFWANFILLDAL